MATTVECRECGSSIRRLPRGRAPETCSECKKARRRKDGENYRNSYKYRPRHLRDQQWIEERRARDRDLQRKSKFGITPEDFRRMMVEQEEKCAICRRPETRKLKGRLLSLAVDHDHTSGQVRGLLCQECNLGLGVFEKHQDGFRNLANYITGLGRSS